MPVEPQIQFHFVVATEGTSEEARSNRRSARSHAGRVNRVRYLRQQRPRPKDGDADLSIVPLRCTPSPVYGSLVPDTFDPIRPGAASYVLRYYMEKIYPRYMQTEACQSNVAVQTPLEWFCRYPGIFHAYHVRAVAHFDATTFRVDWLGKASMVTHKLRVVQYLNRMLSELDPQQVEVALVAMLCLDSGDFESKVCTDSNPFTPPSPPPGWEEDCGSRMTPCPMSTKAIYTLVARLGGLAGIKDPSLLANLARWDLRWASLTISPPKLECAWILPDEERLKYGVLQRNQLPQSGLDSNNEGFGILFERSKSAMQRLAALNDQMNDESRLTSNNLERLGSARCTLHHELLSFPSRHDSHALTETDVCHLDGLTYECCRLTCILYSNAIILAIPPQSGWAEVLLPKLLAVHETIGRLAVTDCSVEIQVWSLMLGAIAAKDGQHRRAFIDMLQKVLSQRELWSWDAVEGILQSKVWSSRFCGQEALVVWEDVKRADFVGRLEGAQDDV